MAHIIQILAFVLSISLLFYGLKFRGLKADKRQLLLFGGLVLLWSICDIGEKFILIDSENIRRIYKVNKTFIGGSAAGVFFSLWVTGAMMRFTRKRSE